MEDLKTELEKQIVDLGNTQPFTLCYTCIALAVAAGMTLSHFIVRVIEQAYF